MARRGMLSGLTERTAENHKSVARNVRNVRNVRKVLLLVNLCFSRLNFSYGSLHRKSWTALVIALIR